MKAYVIANVAVRDADRYAGYVKLTPATIEQFGGRFIARGGRAERLEGLTPVNRVVVIEFPSYERAKAWYASDGYRAAMAIRQSASTASFLLVEGTD